MRFSRPRDILLEKEPLRPCGLDLPYAVPEEVPLLLEIFLSIGLAL